MMQEKYLQYTKNFKFEKACGKENITVMIQF